MRRCACPRHEPTLIARARWITCLAATRQNLSIAAECNRMSPYFECTIVRMSASLNHCRFSAMYAQLLLVTIVLIAVANAGTCTCSGCKGITTKDCSVRAGVQRQQFGSCLNWRRS